MRLHAGQCATVASRHILTWVEHDHGKAAAGADGVARVHKAAHVAAGRKTGKSWGALGMDGARRLGHAQYSRWTRALAGGGMSSGHVQTGGRAGFAPSSRCMFSSSSSSSGAWERGRASKQANQASQEHGGWVAHLPRQKQGVEGRLPGFDVTAQVPDQHSHCHNGLRAGAGERWDEKHDVFTHLSATSAERRRAGNVGCAFSEAWKLQRRAAEPAPTRSGTLDRHCLP